MSGSSRITTHLSSASTLLTAHERLLRELSDELRLIEADGLLRRLTALESVEGPLVRIDGRLLVCWCSNDYLGLSTHPALAEAAANASKTWGIGARASRLLAGSTSLHRTLEAALAAWFGTEAALVYPSGYLANLGTLGALLSPQDAVFVDRLAHASLFDAARATHATLRIFHHNDPAHLATLLSRSGRGRRRLIVTEGVFSMEGDTAPLAELVEVAEAHDAIVYLDDAHGAFVCGATGRGTPEAAGIRLDRFLYMRTLGKALGCQGGFVAGSRTLIDFLSNRARTFLYTTALAVPVVAAAVEALDVMTREPQHLERLHARARRLHQRLNGSRGTPSSHPPSLFELRSGSAPRAVQGRATGLPVGLHILPIVVGGSREATDLARRLWDRGIWAPAIRPPTVPEGTARIRLSVTALHTDPQIDQLGCALEELGPPA